MTKERREEVALVALALSVAVHAGLMWFARPQVMTRAVSPCPAASERGTMRVTARAPRPDPVRIEELLDLKPLRDAPAAESEPVAPAAGTRTADAPAMRLPVPDVSAPVAPPPAPAAVFEARVAGEVAAPPPVLRRAAAEAPTPSMASLSAPAFPAQVSAVPKDVSVPAAPALGAVPLPARMSFGAAKPKSAFVPTDTVRDRVDEKVVAEEKAAVRTLVNAEDAAELGRFANVAMTAAERDGARYFKVYVSPRSELKVVPKDVVLLIDGSGSIGHDRFGNCRKAARRILRTCTNSGDRFNLVVFRNAFTYAFGAWHGCDAVSFEAGDGWLSRQTAHGRTDVFSTIRSVLTLPRDPARPLIALVVTDGEANMGVSDTAEILSQFTALNDGLVSVYMYGVKSSANRELIDVLTRGNRGESLVFDGWRWNAGEGMEELSERFRDPVLSDLRVVFAANVQAEAYPRLLRNLYAGDTLSFVGRVPAGTQVVAFALKGINGRDAYEGFFELPFATAAEDPSIVAEWSAERAIDRKLWRGE